MFLFEIGAGTVLLGAMLAIIWQYPRLLLWVVLACVVLDQLLKLDSLHVGVNIYPLDAIFGLAAVVGVVRYFARLRSFNIALTCAFGLFICIIISLLRGISEYGVWQAGVEVRGVFYLVAGLLYFGTFRWSEQQRDWLVNAWFLTAAILLLIAAYRWGGQVLGLGGGWAEVYGSEGNEGRVLNSAGAMFVAVAFFLSLSLFVAKRGSVWQRFSFWPFGVAIVLLKHRTLWFGSAVVLIMLALSDRRFRLRSMLVLVSVLLIAVLAIVLLPTLSTGTHSFELTYGEAISDDSTFMWRYDSWVELLGPARGFVDYVIGTPFGAGYTRYLYGHYIENTPHNQYVLLLLRVGGIGLVLLVFIYLLSFRAVNRQNLGGMLGERSFWRAVLLLQMLYCITYGLNYEQSILLSVVIANSNSRLVWSLHANPFCCQNSEG